MADLKISQLTGATTPLAGTETLPVVQSSTTKKVSVADLTNGRLVNAATLQTSGGPVGSLAASKWLIQTEDTTATRSYACGPDTSTYGTWELYLTKATTSPALALGCYATYSMLQAAGIGGIKVDTSTNTTVQSGNLIFDTAAKGINFTANTAAAGMTSQLLNWYETGTFTPVVADAATGGNVAAAATTSGIYTRVGNVVTVQFQASSINTTGMTAGNNLYIRGLPFANNSSQTANGVVDMRNTAFTVYPTVFLATSESAVRFFEHTSGAGVAPILVSAVTASSAFFVTLTYTV